MRNVFRGLKIAILASSMLLVSCGQNGGHQFIKSAKLKPYTVDSNVFAQLVTELDFGNMVVPSVSYTVKNPQQNIDIGQVDITAVAGGRTALAITVNITNLTSIKSSYPQLPNGALVPLIAANEALDIKLFNTQAHLYAAIFEGAAALGVAVPVSAFDALGKSVGNTSLFPNFNLGGVIGAAGIFTSSTAGQSGFGVFADISAVLSQKSSVSSKAAQLLAVSSLPHGRLDYREMRPSSSTEKKINDGLYKLHQQKARLTVVR